MDCYVIILRTAKIFFFIDYYVSIWHTIRILLWCFYYVSISCTVSILLLWIVSILPNVGFLFWSNDTFLSYAPFKVKSFNFSQEVEETEA